MAQLKATVTKEEFEALAEPLREFYTQAGDKYALEAPEGFSPKSKVDEFRQTNIDLMKERDDLKKKYGDLDMEVVQEALKLKKELEEKKLLDAGEIDKLVDARVAEMQKEHKKQIDKRDQELASKDARLSELLIDNAIKDAALKPEVGVLPKAIPIVVKIARDVWKLDEKGNPVATNNGAQIYGKNGELIGMEEWVGNLKADYDYLFGQPAGGGGGDGDKPPPGPHKKKSEMSRAEKVAYVDKYGSGPFLKLPR